MQVDQGISGWCPRCQIRFGIKSFEDEGRCPLCGDTPPSGFLQIDSITYICRNCRTRFGASLGTIPSCPNCSGFAGKPH